jgi:hypothetical protein
MQVHIEKVLDLKRQLREINSADLKDITWLKDGKKIDCLKEHIDGFKFIGLSNTEFVELYLEDY